MWILDSKGEGDIETPNSSLQSKCHPPEPSCPLLMGHLSDKLRVYKFLGHQLRQGPHLLLRQEHEQPLSKDQVLFPSVVTSSIHEGSRAERPMRS